MTWQAGSLPDPNSTYYIVRDKYDITPIVRERVVPEGAQDQGLLRLDTSAWGQGEFLLYLVQVVCVPMPPAGCHDVDEPLSNYAYFQIP